MVTVQKETREYKIQRASTTLVPRLVFVSKINEDRWNKLKMRKLKDMRERRFSNNLNNLREAVIFYPFVFVPWVVDMIHIPDFTFFYQ